MPARRLQTTAFFLALAAASPAMANACLYRQEGLGFGTRALLLGSIALSLVILFRGGRISAWLGDILWARWAYNALSLCVLGLGAIAVVHNVFISEYFAINPQLHPEHPAPNGGT